MFKHQRAAATERLDDRARMLFGDVDHDVLHRLQQFAVTFERDDLGLETASS